VGAAISVLLGTPANSGDWAACGCSRLRSAFFRGWACVSAPHLYGFGIFIGVPRGFSGSGRPFQPGRVGALLLRAPCGFGLAADGGDDVSRIGGLRPLFPRLRPEGGGWGRKGRDPGGGPGGRTGRAKGAAAKNKIGANGAPGGLGAGGAPPMATRKKKPPHTCRRGHYARGGVGQLPPGCILMTGRLFLPGTAAQGSRGSEFGAKTVVFGGGGAGGPFCSSP